MTKKNRIDLLRELISDFNNIKDSISLENFKNKSRMVLIQVCKESNYHISVLNDYLAKYSIRFSGAIGFTPEQLLDIKNGISKQMISNFLELILKEIEIDEEVDAKMAGNRNLANVGPPIIKDFKILPRIAQNGDVVTLYWDVENSDPPIKIVNLHETGGPGIYDFGKKMKGSYSFSINAKTDVEYILKAKNSFGEVENKVQLIISNDIGQMTRRVKILISSPSDVEKEKICLKQIVEGINQVFCDRVKIFYELIYWEKDARPGIGDDSQDVINKTLPDDYHIYLGIMWKKFGTPTKRANSGTEEEFNRALERYRKNKEIDILFYFRKLTKKTKIKLYNNEIIKIENFQKRLKKEGILYFSYRDLSDFQSQIYKHLSQKILKISGKYI